MAISYWAVINSVEEPFEEQGREKATGRGIANVIRGWYLKKEKIIKGSTYIIQGFGNVGSNTALYLDRLGMKCIGIGDHTGYIYNRDGINIKYIIERSKKDKSIENYGKYRKCKKLDKESFFKLKTDIIILAALELQVCDDFAQHLNCQLVVEGANGPTNLKADEILEKKGIEVLPDVLANSGGVVVSYYEWLQNRSKEYLDEEIINKKLDNQMIKTFNKVYHYSIKKKISYRTSSYILALQYLYNYYLLKK